MKVIVKPNNKIPIRGVLSKPFTDEKELDLTDMQIKRVLGFDAKVFVRSLDGIKAEIKIGSNGKLDTSDIEQALKNTVDTPVSTEEVTPSAVDAEEKKEELVEDKQVNEDKPVNTQQHMTKAQRRAARRAEAQQKAAEEAVNKEETVEDAEDAAKDNAQVIESDVVNSEE